MPHIKTEEMFFAIGVGLLSILVYIWFKYKFSYWKHRGFTSLPGKIPLGSIGDFGFDLHTCEIFKRYYDQYKGKTPALGLYFFTKPILLPIEPEFLKEIFVRNFESFHDHGFYQNPIDDPLSKNIFFSSGSQWKAMRTKLTPIFTTGKIKLMFETLLETSQSMVEYLKPFADTCSELEMKEILASVITDNIVSIAFGLEAKCLGDPDNEFRKIANSIVNPPPLKAMKLGFVQSFQDFSRYLGLTINDEHTIEFFKEMVKKTMKYREDNKVMRNDLLQLLIQLRHEGESMSIDEIAANCFMFFFAGHETSSSAAMFALYELALHQEIQNQLRKEVTDIMKKYNGKMIYDAIMDMKYLDMVFCETLRKYPVVDVQFRKCTKDFKIPDSELVVQGGTSVMIPVYALQNDERHFENPEKFNPERFTEENKRNIQPFTYIPFGEGPRNCIGQRFGAMQTKIVLATLLLNFRFSPCDKTTIPMKFKPGSAFQTPVGGMWLKIESL